MNKEFKQMLIEFLGCALLVLAACYVLTLITPC